MTGVFHHTQAGEVAETWSMSSSVLLQTESINIEVFSRSTELRGEVLESQQRLSELHRELMRATTKEERERENYPIPEAERITRLASITSAVQKKSRSTPRSTTCSGGW